MFNTNLDPKNFSNNQILVFVILLSTTFKIIYLYFNEISLFLPNLGGDVCNHFNIAGNFSKGKGLVTDFIFSYWHLHDGIPALIDLYPPGFYIFSGSLMKLIGNSYLSARIIIFFISTLSLILFIKTAEKVFNKKLVLFSSIFFSLNIFYLQHSIIFMSIIFYMLIIQIFFFLCIQSEEYLEKNKYIFIALLGLFNGIASISFNGWQIIFLFSLIILVINSKKLKITDILYMLIIFIIFFSPLFLWWGFTTKEYFGYFNYSNLKRAIYHPGGWVEMMGMDSVAKGSLTAFFKELNLFDYLKNFIFRSFIAFEKISDSFFPFIIGIKKITHINFFITPFTIILIIYGALKLDRHGILLLSFCVILFSAFCFSWHVGIKKNVEYQILYRYGLYFFPICCIFIFKALERISYNHYFDLAMYFYVALSFVIVINFNPLSSRDTSHHYEFGQKISELTNDSDVVIYPFNTPDLFCISNRKGINDRTLDTQYNKNLLKFSKKYQARYLFLDFSNYIYKKDPTGEKVKNIEKILNYYRSVKPEMIYNDKKKGMFFFKLKY